MDEEEGEEGAAQKVLGDRNDGGWQALEHRLLRPNTKLNQDPRSSLTPNASPAHLPQRDHSKSRQSARRLLHSVASESCH